jgi:hypothetical protein
MKTKLSAREWIQSVLVSSFKRIEDLKILTIRQLKALASKINKQLGQVIVKALFKKVMSNMTKAELIHAIWSVRTCQNQTVVYSSELVAVSNRIYEFNYCGGAPGYDHWISYFGFNKTSEGSAEQNAERFRQWLLKNGHCRLAALRKSDRLSKFGFEFEVKVWGIKNNIFDCLVKKGKKSQEEKHKEQTKPFAEKTYEEKIAQLKAQLDGTVGQVRTHVLKLIHQLGFVVLPNGEIEIAF